MSDDLLPNQQPYSTATKQNGINVFRKHPRITAFSIGLVLFGCAMTALGISAVNRADYEMEQGTATSTLVECELPLQTLLAHQTLELSSSDLAFSRETYTTQGDTSETLLKRLDIKDEEAQKFLRNDPIARMILESNRPVRISVSATADGSLKQLTAGLRSKTERHFNRITIKRNTNQQLTSISETVPVEIRERVAAGQITYSLYGATDAIGLPVNIAYELADIFSSRIDFTRHLRKGDSFQLVYESYEADGVPLGVGRILAAQFKNGSRTFDAVYFQTIPNKKGAYYTFDGKSLKTVFLDYPLQYTRISSNFGKRLHPIQKTWREHKGIDYAAPTGTSVRTVGDGVVEFAGVQNGYGNIVIVKHDKTRTTAYAHLSRIDVSKGQLLEQGDVIGAVGMTGWATGPHLHFEFRENKVQKDPKILSTQTEAVPIPENLQADFDTNSQTSALLLARIANLTTVAKTN